MTLPIVPAGETGPAPSAAVWSIPAAWYHDPAIYEEERRKIFRAQWLWVGREDQLARPGTYLTATVAGFPIFVARDPQGRLVGFHNVCRHRAAPLLTKPSGSCKVLACPYHGWSYEWDGRLRRAPRFGEERDFPGDALSLFPFRVDSWAGLVFVNLDGEAPPLDAWLGPVRTRVEEAAPRDRIFHTELVYELDCNWKNYVDNYQDPYHIPLLHPALNRDLDMPAYRVVNFPGGSFHEAPPRGQVTAAGVFGWRFPNLAFNAFQGVVAFQRMEPVGPSKTRLVYNYFRGTDVPEEAADAAVAYGDQTSSEDRWIAPLVQANLEAAVYDVGPLSPRFETGIEHFHGLLRTALGRSG